MKHQLVVNQTILMLRESKWEPMSDESLFEPPPFDTHGTGSVDTFWSPMHTYMWRTFIPDDGVLRRIQIFEFEYNEAKAKLSRFDLAVPWYTLVRANYLPYRKTGDDYRSNELCSNKEREAADIVTGYVEVFKWRERVPA